MQNINSKLPEVSTTIFTVMSQMASHYNAINLSQGFPNFDASSELINLVTKAMQEGHNQYAPMPGFLPLREIIAEKNNTLYNRSYHPETEVTITSGATQAIFTIIATFISSGDEVIIFKPAYDSYEPSISLFGGTVIPIQLSSSTYSVNWEEVASKISSKTKMIIINTPHNPSGSVLSKEDMLRLEKLLKDTDIILLSDEVYEHIIFEGQSHQSAALYNGLAERAFITASFGKTFHTTGWKTGYCLAPKELMTEFRKVHQFNVFSGNNPIQHALATYLKTPDNYLYLSNFYQKKRDFFLSLIANSRFSFTPASGTYFQLLNYSSITKENDIDFAERLTKEHKVAAIPVSVFNHNNRDDKVLRFCFAKTEDTLKRAAEILCNI
ncbi:methionine aminotransferase [Aquimarina aquimarini]|uniref:methionine aminotransferase n=1 Tax=Aquimarina aquimarini TaxID=1191734 RepID=UPI000D55B461|nr:methionine aminotransferase [Aquimarina aquimarini]